MSKAIDASIAPTPASSTTRRAAGYLFWLLWFANFINYTDRWAVTAVLKPITHDFQLSDFQAGLLGTAFLFTYTVGVLPLGLLADRIKRKFVVTGGITFWSLVTGLTAFAPNFGALFATRAALGLGEGSYFPASTSMLSAVYSPKDRAKVMSRWNTGLLIGAAVGVTIGGMLFDVFNDWRPVFLVFGVPGLILAFLISRVKEPPRNAAEEASGEIALARRGFAGVRRELGELLKIPTLRVTVALQALSFFVFGATGLFLAELVSNEFAVSVPTAGTITGAVLFLGGVTGLLVGGVVADRLIRRFPGARVLVSGWSFIIAAPVFGLAVLTMIHDFGLARDVRLYGLFVPLFFLSVALLQVNSGPLTAVSQDVVTPIRRAAAVGLTLMLSHLLGDLFSPPIVGALSDYMRAHAATFAMLAITKDNALGVALLLTCVPILLIAGVIGIRGSRAVRGDLAAAEAASKQG